jgi:hypothetical protein
MPPPLWLLWCRCGASVPEKTTQEGQNLTDQSNKYADGNESVEAFIPSAASPEKNIVMEGVVDLLGKLGLKVDHAMRLEYKQSEIVIWYIWLSRVKSCLRFHKNSDPQMAKFTVLQALVWTLPKTGKEIFGYSSFLYLNKTLRYF